MPDRNVARLSLITPNHESLAYSGWSEVPALMCPKYKTTTWSFLHHEKPWGATIKILYKDKGGYIDVWYKDCPNALIEDLGNGEMLLQRIAVDTKSNDHFSRVVLVYICRRCGAQQVVKPSCRINASAIG